MSDSSQLPNSLDDLTNTITILGSSETATITVPESYRYDETMLSSDFCSISTIHSASACPTTFTIAASDTITISISIRHSDGLFLRSGLMHFQNGQGLIKCAKNIHH